MTISVSTQEINESGELPVLLLPPVVVGAAPLQQLGLHGLSGPQLAQFRIGVPKFGIGAPKYGIGRLIFNVLKIFMLISPYTHL